MPPLSQAEATAVGVHLLFTRENQNPSMFASPGRVAIQGLVRTAHPESFPFVHHLTTGRLRKALIMGRGQKTLPSFNPRGEVSL